MTEYSNMPIFAMRGNFFFPNVRAKVEIAREISRNAFRFGIDHGRKIFLVSQIDPDRADVPAETDLYTVGVIAKITSIGSATAEKFEIMVSTLEAARITRFNASPDLLLADVETLDYYIVNKDDARALFDMTVGYIKQYGEVNTAAERIDPKTFTTPDGGVDYLAFTNVVGNELVTRLADRQRLLEENNLETRMEKICAYIIGELDIAAAEKRVANRVKKQIADGQKEYYLREQMKAISAELGEDANEKQEYLDKIKACGMPQDVAEKANKELSRLSRMSSTSPDAAVIRNYLDWLCDVPWTNETQDNADLALARTSKLPGRTRLVNYFLINDGMSDEFLLADLPGYGFAKVSDAEKLKWADLLEKYLAKEKMLKHVFFLVDIRHDPTADDVTMYNYLFKNNIPYTIVATKADKVPKSQVKNRTRSIANYLKVGEGNIIAVSGLAKTGKEEVLDRIEKVLVAHAESLRATDDEE